MYSFTDHVTKTAFQIRLNHIKASLRVYRYIYIFFFSSQFSHNNDFIQQLVFGDFNLYVLLFITIKRDMKTAEKIINNVINENIFLLKISSLKTR